MATAVSDPPEAGEISILPDEERANIIRCLKRIEEQVKDVQRLVEEGRDCLDVISQLAAVMAATNAVSAKIVEAFALGCLRHPDKFASPEAAIEQAVQVLARGSR